MEDSIGRMLAETSRLMRRAFDLGARDIGVTRPQWQVLSALDRHEGCNQVTLAELLDIEPITLCRIVDRLQLAGLVERRRDPADRRVWRLFLTPEAMALLQQLKPIGEVVMASALQGMSEKEQQMLRKLLNKVRQNLGRDHLESIE